MPTDGLSLTSTNISQETEITTAHQNFIFLFDSYTGSSFTAMQIF